MGTSVDPGRPALPPIGLHRILTPDEFQQAQQMDSQSLADNPFPALPPVPRDATRGRLEDRQAPGVAGHQMTGLGRILTQQVAQPIMDHPLTDAAFAMVPGAGIVGSGLMAKDLAEYAMQKHAESQMSPENRAKAEANPNRISGERASVEAVMLGLAPLIHAGARAMGGAEGAEGVAGVAPREPATGESAAGFLESEEGSAGIPPEMTAAVKSHAIDVADSFKKMVAPDTRGSQAAEAASILRANAGDMAAQYEQAAWKVDEFRRAIEPLPMSDKLGFYDAAEHGASQPSPEFQPIADFMRQELDRRRDIIRGFGTGKLENYIENYMPHSGVWEDPDRAAVAFENIVGGKRPMEGTKSFLKERTIPTVMDGVRAGVPIKADFNPADVFLLNIRNMDRYIMAHQSFNEMKDADFMKFVRAGDAPPDGYARIDDKIATVFGPRQGAVQLPEGANIEPKDVTVPGLRIMGEHWAPEPVAKIVNNYLSPGLRGNALYDAYRGLGNTLNQAQLGLSAFHLGMTSIDASVSRAALGLEYLADGNVAGAAKKIGTAPFAPFSAVAQGTVGDLANFVGDKFGSKTRIQLGLGAKIRDAYLNPEGNTDPEVATLANAVKEAGGRVKQDSFYANNAIDNFFKGLKDRNAIQVGRYSLPALIEATAKPLMEHIVPLQKLQVFGEMAQKVLKDLPDDASLTERRQALQGAWDSVDNRMGQLVYDNLFWNKAFKDLAMGTVRSVGWNLGTIRELGGGVRDLATAPSRLAAGEDLMTHKAAYAVALPLTVGLYGAVYQYLRTGEGPSELKDYFYPKTGEKDDYGNDERVQLPSYVKDVMAYSHSPWQTIKNKVGPVPELAVQMLNNQNFFGDEIRNPDDPAVKQLKQEAEYVGKEVLPFSYTNMKEQESRGSTSEATKLGNWFGITPAPRTVVRTQAENEMGDLARRQRGIETPEQQDASNARSDLYASLRSGDGDRIEKAINSNGLTPKDVQSAMKKVGLDRETEQFKRLTAQDAIRIFKDMTPAEQEKVADVLVKKIDRAAKSGKKIEVP